MTFILSDTVPATKKLPLWYARLSGVVIFISGAEISGAVPPPTNIFDVSQDQILSIKNKIYNRFIIFIYCPLVFNRSFRRHGHDKTVQIY